MATDDERREVAERLRELGKLVYSPDNTYELMADALGVDDFEGTDELFARLADLIEPAPKRSEAAPKCDRGALLALADEMEIDGAGALDDGDWCKPLLVEYARRIREACGVGDSV